MRRSLRRSLTTQLFGRADFLSLRLRLGIATFLQVCTPPDSAHSPAHAALQTRIQAGSPSERDLAQLVTALLDEISIRVLSTLVRHLVAVLALLTRKLCATDLSPSTITLNILPRIINSK